MTIDPSVLDALRWPLEALSLLALIGMGSLVIRNWSSLPEQVPYHFGITGQPDRYGRRRTIFILPAVALVMYIAMSLGGETMGLLLGEAPPDLGAAFMVTWAKAITLLMMCFCLWTIVRVAQGKARRMNVFVLLALVALALLPALTGIVKS